ncbi:MAG: hypothetical protein AAF725_08115 [Acidobacteriota bacterium]
MVSRPIKHLLTGIVDYAGLFPPAKLDMEPAVAEFGRQRASRDAWILGRFVVPAARLEELERAYQKLGDGEAESGPWRLSVLVGGDAAAARAHLDSFNARNAGWAVADAIETKPSSTSEIDRVAAAFEGFEIFFELPHDRDPGDLMAAVARVGGRAKIRTGGVSPDAFPSIGETASFLVAAHRAGIPLKATAGLHHPLPGEYRLTYEPESPTGTMHGFLNLFIAAAFVRFGGLGETELKELLGERNAGALEFSSAGVSWRGHRLSAEALAEARREMAISYGSCSFQEPVDDLRALHLI